MDDRYERGRDTATDPYLDDPTGSDVGFEERAGADPEIEAIVVGIETTRAEMSQTVDELGDRLDPASAVRDATIGKLETKVNDMTNTATQFASDAGQTAQDAGAGVVDTIKRNPVPAALAAVGIGWLVLSRSDGRSSGRRSFRDRSTDRWTSPTLSTSDYGASSDDWQDELRRRSDDVGDMLGDATSNARRSAADTFDSVQDRAGSAADTVTSSASDALSSAQGAMERNPLAFGAIALAVGTAVGLALPASSAEKRIMGSAGGQLIDKVESAVSQPLDEMRRQQESTAGAR
jgi:ElaB/YqjD/DUF883 family membrane-anchored ribosome-binding protein